MGNDLLTNETIENFLEDVNPQDLKQSDLACLNDQNGNRIYCFVDEISREFGSVPIAFTTRYSLVPGTSLIDRGAGPIPMDRNHSMYPHKYTLRRVTEPQFVAKLISFMETLITVQGDFGYVDYKL
jgi:hypothetical protein